MTFPRSYYLAVPIVALLLLILAQTTTGGVISSRSFLSSDDKIYHDLAFTCKPLNESFFEQNVKVCKDCQQKDLEHKRMFSKGIGKPEFRYSCTDKCFNTTVFGYCVDLVNGTKDVIVFELERKKRSGVTSN